LQAWFCKLSRHRTVLVALLGSSLVLSVITATDLQMPSYRIWLGLSAPTPEACAAAGLLWMAVVDLLLIIAVGTSAKSTTHEDLPTFDLAYTDGRWHSSPHRGKASLGDYMPPEACISLHIPSAKVLL
jgi:hypothetical protein